MISIVSKLGLLSVIVILYAPALKVRFDLTDMMVYYAPAVLLILTAVSLNILKPAGVMNRFGNSVFMILPLLASGLGFLVGQAGESELLIRVFLNCCIGAAVILLPWNEREFGFFALVCALLSTVLALNTMATYGDLGVDYAAVKVVDTGRLSVSFCIGLGAITSLYLVIRSFNPIYVAFLAVCWIGLVLNISRGPVFFGVVASVFYLLFAMFSTVSNFGVKKKWLILILIGGLTPVVVSQMMNVEFIANRFAKMFDTSEGLETAGRGELWADSIDKISQAPLFGHGLGSYFTDEVTPHNVILQFGEDSGLTGIILMLFFFGFGAKRFFRSIKVSSASTINMVLATGALFLYTLLNFQKSSDAYINRELYILTALPFAIYAYVIVRSVHQRRQVSRRRRRRHSTRRSHIETQHGLVAKTSD